jgi:lysophospholipase L1-like esterase
MNGNSKPQTAAPKSRRKQLLQNLALSGIVFFLCVAGFEIALRICGYGNLEIYQPDPTLYWRLKPNQDCYTKISHQPVHVNSQGTRGPEFQIEKPAGTIRILSLGDSRTFGWGLADDETYSRRLEQLLQSYVGTGKKVEVINAGVNAWSYPQMLVYFRDFGLKYQPDFVVLAEANLWTQFSEKNSPEFVRQFMWRVRLKNFLRHFAIYHFVVEVQLQSFYERERSKFIPIDPKQDPLFKAQQQSDPTAVFRDAIEGVCRVAQTNHVQPVLLYLPTVNDLTATNRAAVFEVKQAAAKKFGVPLVDLTADLKPAGKKLYLDADPVHLDPQGNAIVAQRLFETFTNSLTK